MGLGPVWLRRFSQHYAANEIAIGDAFLDLGASELFCGDDPASLNRFLTTFGAPTYGEDELLQMADRAFAADLFRRAGFRYDAVDYSNFPGIIRLDLNIDELPDKYHQQYKFVNNAGTSEHILNQYNVFKVMHDAAAPGALMYHGVPGWGEYEHGIIVYSPKFFWELATANDYQIVRFRGSSNNQPAALKPEFMQKIEFPHPPIAERVWLEVVLRKTTDRCFRGLNDPIFNPI